MNILYYDCFAGISGDMHLGALLDLGVDAARLCSELAKLPLEPWRFETARDSRKGIAGMRVTIGTSGHSPHRTFADIRALIEAARLSEQATALSLRIFTVLAEAEARVHAIPVDQVHFHEVGAVDSIVDIVGAALCLAELAPGRVYCSPVELGGGTVTCAHGILPVPAPATAELLKGRPVTLGRTSFESTTPTGAAILAAVVDEFAVPAAATFRRIGYGIGLRDGEIPNVLRVCFGDDGGSEAHDAVDVIEATIDDMSPEWYEHAMDRLFAAGALDVFITPVIMKRSRPGATFTVLCTPPLRDALARIVLAETTTLGVRIHQARRTMLGREIATVATRFGHVRVKQCVLDGTVLRGKPEYEDCRKLATEHNVSLHTVYHEALRAFDCARHEEGGSGFMPRSPLHMEPSPAREPIGRCPTLTPTLFPPPDLGAVPQA